MKNVIVRPIVTETVVIGIAIATVTIDRVIENLFVVRLVLALIHPPPLAAV